MTGNFRFGIWDFRFQIAIVARLIRFSLRHHFDSRTSFLNPKSQIPNLKFEIQYARPTALFRSSPTSRFGRISHVVRGTAGGEREPGLRGHAARRLRPDPRPRLAVRAVDLRLYGRNLCRAATHDMAVELRGYRLAASLSRLVSQLPFVGTERPTISNAPGPVGSFSRSSGRIVAVRKASPVSGS